MFCAVTCFFHCKIVKLLVQVFLLFLFCILYTVFICVVRNCVIVYLPAFLYFDIVYIFTGLPYFLQRFRTFLVCFFCQIVHICIVCFFCRFLPMSHPRFNCLWVVLICFFSLRMFTLTILADSDTQFVLFQVFLRMF